MMGPGARSRARRLPRSAPHPPARGAPKARRYAPFVLLALLAVAFFYPVLFQGKVFLPADLLPQMQPWRSMHLAAAERPHNPILDPIQQYFPWRKFASHSWREGIVPLWNPCFFSGVPFLANNQSALLYPLNLTFFLLPVGKAFGYAACLHFFLGGLFMFLFLRHLRLSAIPSLFGAVGFMLSGFFVCWMEFPTFASVAIWLPLLLLLTSLALDRWAWAIPAGFVLGFQFLGGHSQVSAYVLGAFLAFALFKLLFAGHTDRLRFFASVCLILALGLGIGLAQLLPTFEYSRYNFPKGGSYADIAQGAYSPLEALLFFIPNLFGNPVTYNDSNIRAVVSALWDQGLRNYFEACNYVGVATLLVAPFAFLNPARKARQAAFFFLALAAFALLAAFPTPVTWLLYRLAPGFRQLVHVTRSVYVWGFAVPALAALGLQHLLTSSEKQAGFLRYHLASSAGIIIVVAVIGLTVTALPDSAGALIPGLRAYCSSQVARFVLLSSLSLGLIYIIAIKPNRYLGLALLFFLLADLFTFAHGFNPMVAPDILKTTPRSIQACQEEPQYRIASIGPDFLNRFPPNLPSAFNLKDIQGTDSFCPSWYWQVLSDLRREDEFGLRNGLSSPFLDLLSVRHILAPPDFPAPERFLPLAQPDAALYLNPHAMPRASWVPRALSASPEEALQRISEGLVDPRTTVLLAAAGASQPPSFGSEAGTGTGEVSILSDHPNEVVIGVSAPAAGFVALSDSFFPGWRAFLDGKPTPIFLADASFRAAQAPSGEHTLRFAFLPSSFKVGFFALLCSLMAGTGLLTYARLQSVGRANSTSPRREP